MPRTRPPYSPEFRRQMVNLVRAGRSPEELAREFEPTAHGEGWGMKNPSRRALLGCAAVLAIAPVTFAAPLPPQPHPDADLIATCVEFDACERQTAIIHGTGPDCVVDDNEANLQPLAGPAWSRPRPWRTNSGPDPRRRSPSPSETGQRCG